MLEDGDDEEIDADIMNLGYDSTERSGGYRNS
jgi:hypothetical protein